MRREGARPERRLRDADQPRVLLGRGLGVDREDHPLLRQRLGHHHAAARRDEMVEDHLLDRKGAGDQAEDGALRMALAVERQMRPLEAQPVARRPAQHLQVAERRVDGRRDQLLAPAEPVDHQEPEPRPARRRAANPAASRAQRRGSSRAPGAGAGRAARSPPPGTPPPGRRPPPPGRRGRRRRRSRPPRSSRARGSPAPSAVAQLRRQRREHRPLRGEDEHQRRRHAAELRRISRAAAPGSIPDRDHPRPQPGSGSVGHLDLHPAASSRQRVKMRALLARSAAWVRLLTLILVMIAAMWVFTVASAIESS